MIPLLLEIAAYLSQTLSTFIDKKKRSRPALILFWIGLVLWLGFRGYNYYSESQLRGQIRAQQEKLVYQEAVLSRVAERELARAHAEVLKDQGKLVKISRMRSQFLATMRQVEDGAPAVANP